MADDPVQFSEDTPSPKFEITETDLHGAAGAVLVCDLTRSETLDSLKTYASDLLEISPNAQFVLASNKCDLTGQQ